MSDDGNCISLETNLVTSEVESLYETLKCLLATQQDVVIDGGLVESIDTSAIQLLVAFVKSVEATGCRVKWKAISEQFEKTTSLLGLDTWIQCE